MEIKITCSMEQEHGLIYKGFYIGYSGRDACDVIVPRDTHYLINKFLYDWGYDLN